MFVIKRIAKSNFFFLLRGKTKSVIKPFKTPVSGTTRIKVDVTQFRGAFILLLDNMFVYEHRNITSLAESVRGCLSTENLITSRRALFQQPSVGQGPIHNALNGSRTATATIIIRTAFVCGP